MDGLKHTINENTLLIAIASGALAVAAAFPGWSIPAVVLGLVCGMAFMWMARPPHAPDVEEEE